MLRTAAGLSQEKLGEQCGVHATTIGLIERGQEDAQFSTLEKILGGLNLYLWELGAMAEMPSRAVRESSMMAPPQSLNRRAYRVPVVVTPSPVGYEARSPTIPEIVASGRTALIAETTYRQELSIELQRRQRLELGLPISMAYVTYVEIHL